MKTGWNNQMFLQVRNCRVIREWIIDRFQNELCIKSTIIKLKYSLFNIILVLYFYKVPSYPRTKRQHNLSIFNTSATCVQYVLVDTKDHQYNDSLCRFLISSHRITSFNQPKEIFNNGINLSAVFVILIKRIVFIR